MGKWYKPKKLKMLPKPIKEWRTEPPPKAVIEHNKKKEEEKKKAAEKQRQAENKGKC